MIAIWKAIRKKKKIVKLKKYFGGLKINRKR